MEKLNILQQFNNLNTRNKLLISYIVVVFLPVLLVGLILTESMKQMAMERTINEVSINVERLNNRITEIMKIPMDISTRTNFDINFEEIMSENYTSTLDIVNAYSSYTNFDSYLTLYREIEDITFYSYNKTILDSGQFVKITKEISDIPWFQKTLHNNKQMYWQYIYNKNKGSYLLSLISCIKKNTAGETIGVLTIGVKRNYLYSILKNEPYDIMIISDDGYIITAKNPDIISKKVDEVGLSYLLDMDMGIHEINYKNQLSKVILKTFKPTTHNGDFRIVSLFPVQSIEGESAKVTQLGFLIMSISLLFALILILIFSNAISKRIKSLSKYMHKVASGNFDFTPIIEGKDEIGQLSKDLDIMVKSINQLVHEVYEANLQKKQLTIHQREIKLKMLANQINPHFLFNVLETIRMKAHCKGEHELAEVVKMLGKLMRRNLEVGNKFVSLESEIDMVKSYLEIQRFRYGDRITYEIINDFDIADCKILPLIIQPIIENSIVHGLENKSGIGNVKLVLLKNFDILKIIIEDNGVGMTPERLEYVQNTLEETEDVPGRRIGVKNVYQRIKLHYGDKYGLNIYSKENVGTKIEIILPGAG